MTKISPIQVIIENTFFSFMMSTVTAILPILSFYLLPFELAMLGSRMIGVGMVFTMRRFAGKLGEEENPIITGLMYAAIVIVGIEVLNLVLGVITLFHLQI